MQWSWAMCASDTKQYNLVPVNGHWRSEAGKVTRGVASILHWGGTEAELRRRENRGAEGAEGGGVLRRWCLPPHLTWGSGKASWDPPTESGEEPRPPTHFSHIWGPQNTSGGKNNVTLLRYFTSFFRKKSTQSTIGGMALLPPLWLRPWRWP